ncbi:hypothetical protein G6F57_021516 [Rhizopus arrhizus]|nr:hypothetical protein G6F57_021516 [Rhizopus arrhizus]
MALRISLQHRQITALDLQPPPMVHQQTVRDGAQVSPRLAQRSVRRGGGVCRQQAHERVLRQIRRAMRIAQLQPQPAVQPGMMVAVQRRDAGGGAGARGSGHGDML